MPEEDTSLADAQFAMEPHVQIRMRLAQDCYEYIQFLVTKGNAENLTEAIESCIRESRQAQRIR